MVDLNDRKLEETLVHKAELMQQRGNRTWRANFGMIASLGGVIIVPILLGLWGGSYLDEVLPQRFSWRLSLLFVGFTWGFVNAYYWIKIENEKIDRIGSNRDGK
ncbi:MAG: AtpZ/AtpI family protein [Alphaproteobacteria bacterium]